MSLDDLEMYLATRTGSALPQPLPAAWIPMQAVPESPRGRVRLTHLPFGIQFFNLLHPSGCPCYLPSAPNSVNLTPITNVWLTVRSPLIAVATTIALPCVEEPGKHIALPMTPEPEHPSQEVHHPKDRAEPVPSTTIPATGTGSAVHPANNPTISQS